MASPSFVKKSDKHNERFSLHSSRMINSENISHAELDQVASMVHNFASPLSGLENGTMTAEEGHLLLASDAVRRRGMSVACNDFNSSLYAKRKNQDAINEHETSQGSDKKTYHELLN